MVHRIEVGFKPSVRDAWGEKVKKKMWDDFHCRVDRVQRIDVYTLDMVLSPMSSSGLRKVPLLIPSSSTTPLTHPLRGISIGLSK